MTRIYVYGGVGIFIALCAWWMWSDMHPGPAMQRARTEQAERMQVDPPPKPQSQAEIDSEAGVASP